MTSTETPWWVVEQAKLLYADSKEYEVLEDAARRIVNVPGLSLEIGVRTGGSTKKIMDVFMATGQADRTHIGVDPYGNIEYTHYENVTGRIGYTNQMRNLTFQSLYEYCSKFNLDVRIILLEDTEFFKRFADGLPVYKDVKTIINQYALVFFDGPHCVESVKAEFDFFKDRVVAGSMLVFDDIDQYPHMEKLHNYILAFGFKEVMKGIGKISYVKTAF